MPLTRRRPALAVWAALGLIAVLLTPFAVSGGSRRDVVGAVSCVTVSLFATAWSVAAARRSRGRQRLAWAIMSTGLLGWTAGQAAGFWAVVTGAATTSLSGANLAYVLLPLFAMATAATIPSRDDSRFGAGLLIDGVLITASFLIVLDIVALGQAGQLLATATALYWGLVATTFIVVRKSEAKRQLSPTLMTLGWAVIGAAGVLHIGGHDDAGSAPGDLVMSGWTGGVYLIALSAITSRPGPDIDLGISQPSPRGSLWLPYLPVLLAVIVGAVHFWPAYRDEAIIFSVCVSLFLITLIRQILLLDRKQRLLTSLSEAALRDPLTGLANRRLFHDRLTHALRLNAHYGVPVSLIAVSVDDFKLVNDMLGYAVGDELLRGVGSRIETSVDPRHTVARMGGDDFAILVEDRPEKASQIAEDLALAFDDPVLVEDHRLDVSLSIGVASASSDIAAGRMPGDILRQAGTARSYAKVAGTSNVRTFTTAMSAEPPAQDAAIARLQLLGELRRAIENASLSMLYQPKFSVKTGLVTGAEALVRWRHPKFGMLEPGRFLPLVREHGLIHALTDLVLETAICDAAAWHACNAPIPVAINLGAPSLNSDALPDHILSLLRAHGLSPSSLTVEITEDLLVADLAKARRVLDRMRAAGIRVAIDDFGSGYGSLTYLRELPIDDVKLDRAFIAPILHDHRAATIARSVIELARVFGITSVAEGVEDHATVQRLRDYGCDAVQGNLFCRPLPAADVPQVPPNEALAAG